MATPVEHINRIICADNHKVDAGYQGVCRDTVLHFIPLPQDCFVHFKAPLVGREWVCEQAPWG